MWTLKIKFKAVEATSLAAAVEEAVAKAEDHP
jgi:hypothetical protein